MQQLSLDISEVCERTDRLLWDAYARSGGSQSSGIGTGRLIFPRYRQNGLRVSEQEARFAFFEALLRQNSHGYSVEVPTSKSYSFSGDGERSAQTDLQVQDMKGTDSCNVEFKAEGVSLAGNTDDIYKDVEKLLREQEWGLWFHLLKSVNNLTIDHLLSVIAKHVNEVQHTKKDVESPGLTLHVCVLKHGFSLQKDVLLPIDEVELNKHLRLDLRVSRAEILEIHDLNGWDLKRRC